MRVPVHDDNSIVELVKVECDVEIYTQDWPPYSSLDSFSSSSTSTFSSIPPTRSLSSFSPSLSSSPINYSSPMPIILFEPIESSLSIKSDIDRNKEDKLNNMEKNVVEKEEDKKSILIHPQSYTASPSIEEQMNILEPCYEFRVRSNDDLNSNSLINKNQKQRNISRISKKIRSE